MVIAALASFSTPQDALDARATDPRLTAYIGGVMTPVVSYSGQHGAGQTSTARITLPLPRPAQVTANAEVVVQGGHNDLIGTIFAGTVPEYEAAMTSRGDTIEVQCVGWSHKLQEPFRNDVTFPGPVSADAVFVALCQLAGVPAWIAEAPTFPNGEVLTLGGNIHVDDGAITIRAHSSPLSQFQRLIDPYGYVVSDTPQGPVRFHRVSGVPNTAAVVTFTEGVHLGDTSHTSDYREVVNVWDVNGATYEDQYGGSVPIRSIADPDTVPAHADIPGNGYRYRRVQNSDLVRSDQADAARNRLENDYSEATRPVRWQAVAVPGLAPGDAVAVDCETVEVNGTYWLMGLDISSDDGGFTASYEGWMGAGDEFPGIVDRHTVVIQTDVWHGGDESVAWYAHPAPQGTSKTWNIEIPEDASAVNVRYYQHSWNSQSVAGEDTELTVSRWGIWQPGSDYEEDQPESGGTMPVMPERYGQRPNFSRFVVDSTKQPGDDGYVIDAGQWAPAAVNLGRLDAGEYVLRVACGEKLGFDDGEIRAVYIEYFGLSEAAGYSDGSS